MTQTIDELIITGACLYGLGILSVLIAQTLWKHFLYDDWGNDDEK